MAVRSKTTGSSFALAALSPNELTPLVPGTQLRISPPPRSIRAKSTPGPVKRLRMVLPVTPIVVRVTVFFSIAMVRLTGASAAELFHRAEQLHTKGRYAEAEPLYKEALATKEREHNADRPQLIHMLNGLADLYHVHGRHPEAEAIELP